MAKFWFRLARVRKQLQLPIIECSALPPSKANLTNSLSTLSVKNEPHRFPLYSLCQKTNLTGSLSTLSVKKRTSQVPSLLSPSKKNHAVLPVEGDSVAFNLLIPFRPQFIHILFFVYLPQRLFRVGFQFIDIL